MTYKLERELSSNVRIDSQSQCSIIKS